MSLAPPERSPPPLPSHLPPPTPASPPPNLLVPPLRIPSRKQSPTPFSSAIPDASSFALPSLAQNWTEYDDESDHTGWWKLHDPPAELALLPDLSLPEEIREEIGKLSNQIDEIHVSMRPQPSSSKEFEQPGLEVVAPSRQEALSVDPDDGGVSPLTPTTPTSPSSYLTIPEPSKLRTCRGSLSVLSSTSSSSSLSRRTCHSRSGSINTLAASGSLLAVSPYFSVLPPNHDGTIPGVEKLVSPRAEAIKSFFKKRSESHDCASCFDTHRNRKLATLTCQHKYCHPCLRQLINTATADEALFPPRCCLEEIPPKTVAAALDRKEMKRFKAKVKEYLIPWEQRVYCPQCNVFIPPTAAPPPGLAETFNCPSAKCKAAICWHCKTPAHPPGEDCAKDQTLAAVLEEAERNGWRRCYACRMLVERTAGCTHMRCRCRAEFCYICGERWKTCTCKGDELDVQQREREEMERAVRESERVAREQEAERLEEERRALAEKRWQLILKAARIRRRQEAAKEVADSLLTVRIAEAEAEQEKLKSVLEEVEGCQKEAMDARQAIEQEELSAQRQEAAERLARIVGHDLNAIKLANEGNLQELETMHGTRLAQLQEQHQVEEDENWFSIQTHLRGKPNRAVREAALKERFEMEQQTELQDARARMMQERQSMEVRLQRETRTLVCRLEDNKKREAEKWDRKTTDAARKWKAERRWCEGVGRLRREGLEKKKAADVERVKTQRKELLARYLVVEEAD